MVITQEWNGIHFVLFLDNCALFLFKKLFDKYPLDLLLTRGMFLNLKKSEGLNLLFANVS